MQQFHSHVSKEIRINLQHNKVGHEISSLTDKLNPMLNMSREHQNKEAAASTARARENLINMPNQERMREENL